MHTPLESKSVIVGLCIVGLFAGSGLTSKTIAQVLQAGFGVKSEVCVITVDIISFLDYSEGKRRPTFQADVLGFTDRILAKLQAKFSDHAEVGAWVI